MYLHNVFGCVWLQMLLFNFATSLDPMVYLRRYGYLQQQAHGLLQDIAGSGMTRNAVLDFQRFVGLPQTGVMDAVTLQKMEAPRCGNLDRKLQTSKRRRKRYRVTDGERWNKNTLSYKIFTYSNMMTQSTLNTVIDNAFKYWSAVTNIRFYKSTASHPSQVDIPISFVTGDHGDLTPFDGRGGALAHAFYPRIGDIHFDDAEPWSSINLGSLKKYLLPVAVHEIGHSIGLNHSEVPDAVMAPYYKNYPIYRSFRLNQDDTNAAQSLFGVKANGGGGNTNPPPARTTYVPYHTRPQQPNGSPNYRPTGNHYQQTTFPSYFPSPNAPNYGPSAGPGFIPPYMPTRGPGNNHNFRPTAGVTNQNWIGTRVQRNTENVYVPTKYNAFTFVPTNYQVGRGRAGNTQRPSTSAIDTESFRQWLRRLG